MKPNVGKIDRTIRAVVGIALLVWGLMVQSWIIGIIGVVLLITAAMRFCGLYKIFGIKTCPMENTPAKGEDKK